MSDSDVAQILALPADERMRMVELLWESLAAEPECLPMGEAHRAVLDERLAEHARDPDDVVGWDGVLAEVRRG